MSVTPVEDLLSVDTLSGLVKRFADQSENRIATDLFERRARKLLPAGRAVQWDEVSFGRSLAPVTGVDSPHQQRKRLGMVQRSSTMAMVKLYKDLPNGHLFLDRAPGSETADLEATLANELLDLTNLVQNTKEYLATGALLGKIVVDPTRIPGSELSFKVDFQIPDATSADWSDPGTKLRSRELLRLKRAYKDSSGKRAGILMADESVEGYLVRNREVSGFAREAVSRQVLRGESSGKPPQWQGLVGLDWHFVDGTYQPEGGPVTSYWAEDTALVLPQEARLSQVLGWAEGRVFVPGGDVFAGAEGAASLVREVRGHYAYAQLRTDPIGIRLYVGWYGLPVVLDPRALLRVNVRPAPTPVAP